MANVKISQLPAGSAPTGTEIIPSVQSSQTVSLTVAQIAALSQGFTNAADSGAANAYVLTTPQVPTLIAGQIISFSPAHPNTGASTVNLNGQGVKTLLDSQGNALTGGEVVGPTFIMWTGVLWKLLWALPIVNKTTAAETAAAVTITNPAYPPLNPWRYGADGAGGANDTAAYTALLSVLSQMVSTRDWLNGISIPGYPFTLNESNAKIIAKVNNYTNPSDGQLTLNVFRFFTAAQIADVLAGTGAVDVSAAIQAANDYLEGKAVGAIATLNGLVAGTGYNGGNPGTFNAVNFTGGHGQFMNATVVVGAAGAITSVTIGYSPAGAGTWLGNPGNGYQVADVLTLTSANMVAAGAAAGGTGCTINVATLATGGKQVSQGGTLFFPSGRYFCGTTGLRIGDMVNWVGTGVLGTKYSWSNTYNGNGITIGPDASGFNGRGGVYAMGASLQNCSLEMSNGTGWGIYTLGLQQNGYIKNVWVKLGTGSTGGVFLQDHFGSANMLCEDVYVLPGAASVSGTAVGFHCDGGANVVLSRCSCNGTAGFPLLAGIAYVSGVLTVKDYQCEITATHIDISAGAGQFPVIVDGATLNLASGGVQGIWIHNGFTGTVSARQLNIGPSQVGIRNDNTNEQNVTPGGGALIPFYSWSGTPASDVSLAHNFRYVPPLFSLTIGAGSTTPNPNLFQSYRYTATAAAFTVNAPAMGSNAMPAGAPLSGIQLLFMVRNTSGGALTVTWNAVFKQSFVAPANGFSRSILFQWDGTNWVELWHSPADVAN